MVDYETACSPVCRGVNLGTIPSGIVIVPEFFGRRVYPAVFLFYLVFANIVAASIPLVAKRRAASAAFLRTFFTAASSAGFH